MLNIKCDGSKRLLGSEFVKYSRVQCLLTYMKTCYNKMVEVINEKMLLIHFLQDNLNDATLRNCTRIYQRCREKATSVKPPLLEREILNPGKIISYISWKLNKQK